jgi:predicted Zn-dependent protease
MKLKIALYLFTSLFFYACNKVPVTGRRQMNLMPESNLASMASEQYKQVLANSKVIQNGPQAEMVKRVGNNIAKSVEKFLSQNGYKNRLNQFAWEFNLIDENIVNAWCMPGGKVCFYTGILPITLDENGLAVVMGHEIAHAVARHGNERMSRGMAVSLGGAALDVALAQKPDVTRNLFLQAYGIGTEVGVNLPFSRKNELEADKMGLIFMKIAGYDPTKAPDFWKRMAQNGSNVPEFLSTHPSDEKRIDEITKYIQSKEFSKYTK